MKTSQIGIDLIKFFEGEKLKAYLCPAGIWTIGIGSTFYESGLKVKQGDYISKERSSELLLNTLIPFENIVNSSLKIKVSQNQFDALVSHDFNCGKSGTLYKLVNSKSTLLRDWWETHYITGNGIKLKGLQNRRKAETKLYFYESK